MPHFIVMLFYQDWFVSLLKMVKMEADVLKSLKFEMGSPTIKTFLRQGHYQHTILNSYQ